MALVATQRQASMAGRGAVQRNTSLFIILLFIRFILTTTLLKLQYIGAIGTQYVNLHRTMHTCILAVLIRRSPPSLEMNPPLPRVVGYYSIWTASLITVVCQRFFASLLFISYSFPSLSLRFLPPRPRWPPRIGHAYGSSSFPPIFRAR